MKLQVVSAKNVINYECGCIAEYTLIGLFSDMREFHIIPCFAHTPFLQDITEQAEKDWESVTSEHPMQS